jgi:hypothetical protein
MYCLHDFICDVFVLSEVENIYMALVCQCLLKITSFALFVRVQKYQHFVNENVDKIDRRNAENIIQRVYIFSPCIMLNSSVRLVTHRF